ncbi:MAG: hypothetical protein JNM99_08185 [Verrucomicrobiaceae bacterium]|nr:hypothetical protein [Verrucomicrobiaceae bacterium]
MTTEEHSKELDRRHAELHHLKKPRLPEMEPRVPSKSSWAAAREEIEALEREQGRRLAQQAEKWIRVFAVFHGDESSERWTAIQALDKAEAALSKAGIRYQRQTESRDTERLVPDPEPPGGFCIELGSSTTLALEVTAADEQRALEVIREQKEVTA